MIKKWLFILMLTGFVFTINAQRPADSQTIAKWKIEDVVRSYSANNDTVYIVNFWATFCKPCIEEIPHFIKIAGKYKDQKVKLLLVSLDLPGYYPTKIANFAKKNNYNTHIVWLDETNADHFCPMIDQKWSGAIPSTIIINNSNGYRKFVEDQLGAGELEEILKAAIGGKASRKYTAPMNEAEVFEWYSGESLHKNEFISFKSVDSSVFAVIGGKVNTIAKMDFMKVIIIEKDGLLYTYSNMGSTELKTGDIVKAGQLIGYAANELDGTVPMVDLYISNSEETISLTRHNFIQRKDIKLSDHSIDPIKEPK